MNTNYLIKPTYNDGLVKHYTSQKLDITISRKINERFSLLLFCYDILKTDYNYEKTSMPTYLFQSKDYSDTRTIGLNVRYDLTGKTYKKNEIEKIEDNAIDRL